jgi:AcrR family transcriptional regulator
MSSSPSDLRQEPRIQLIERATDYLMERGLADISLRELASALGTSHRMLNYHFGSKDALFVEVARATEERQRQVLSKLVQESQESLVESARGFWQLLRSPELAPLERLFFELYSQGLQGRAYAQPFLTGIVDSWIEPLLPALQANGLSGNDARAEARLGLAVVRGLLLDVLATGDEAGVDAAFERHLATLGVARPAVRRGGR